MEADLGSDYKLLDVLTVKLLQFALQSLKIGKLRKNKNVRYVSALKNRHLYVSVQRRLSGDDRTQGNVHAEEETRNKR